MTDIEALYIFDAHNNCILEHVYASRPPPARTVLPLYLAHPSPRPSLLHLPNTTPPVLLYSLVQDQLLFLSPHTSDTEPLLVLEFLHRVADALEDFLGSPLLASRIESRYDVVAQLLGEMCDGGLVASTEPNALRDLVSTESWVGKVMGGLGLPGASSFKHPVGPPPSLPPVPWRRANVRHTSNELYVDIVETLLVTLSPSGLPLRATANGTIAFTAKVSGVPDLLLSLTCAGGGKQAVEKTVRLPVFHPCVRLARWRERPGTLSFVPPDGRFVLAGYEVDLLAGRGLGGDVDIPTPNAVGSKGGSSGAAASAAKLNIPAAVEVQTGLGPSGSEFEVSLFLSPRSMSSSASSSSSSLGGASTPSGSGGSGGGRPGLNRGLSSSGSNPLAALSSFSSAGTSQAPTLSDILVRIPLPPSVKSLPEIRPSRGEAMFAAADMAVEWRIASREVTGLMGAGRSGGGRGAAPAATLRCAVVGMVSDDEDEEGEEEDGDAVGGGVAQWTGGRVAETWEYDDPSAMAVSYQNEPALTGQNKKRARKDAVEKERERDERRAKQNAVLMPSGAIVSFQVKGWLASGVRVESLNVDTRASRGLGAGVTPFKGVKYLTVSDEGVESRC
ncbi:Adaptor complexes medium subunit family-domain-containing protein [Lineolata rhizophorae]|uniref:Adaptor complexes medium subunit family-domain-containing protein n=1 Tax=Lineolata rhizophorae TaxID=578093 RepID=A0A6A6P415_9PEZI|nr:Adaptor complexes medium subunit family-domain-containing protein [Lineolata rhizophorae]